MSIDIFSIHPDFHRDIFIRGNFIEAMQINLVNTYVSHNKSVLERRENSLEVYLPQNPSRYKDRCKGNQQTWASHSVSNDDGPDNFTRTSIPLINRLYLSVAFFERETKHSYPELYTATVRQLIGWVSDSLYLDRKSSSQELSPRADPGLHEPDLWPERWVQAHKPA